jgi:Na+/proline symporter
MKTIRVMAIIGIVWFSLSFFGLSITQQSAYADSSRDNIDSLAGWGFLAALYALAFAIVVVAKVKKPVQILSTPTANRSTTAKLIELNELRQKGVLSEDEFHAMKLDVLKS